MSEQSRSLILASTSPRRRELLRKAGFSITAASTGEEALDEDGFSDVATVAARCVFRDCRHDGEPGCAINQAIATGALDAARVANYLKLQAEIQTAAARKAARQAPRSGNRKPSRAKLRRNDQRFGKSE